MASSTGSPTLRRPLSSARPNCWPRVTRPLCTSRQGMTRLASMGILILKRRELADKLIDLLRFRLPLDSAVNPQENFGVGEQGHHIDFPIVAFLDERQPQGRERSLVINLRA